ncbi:MAG: LysR family transcriptional regulator [Salinisphaera sp.]|nr:LysR family transcriptional regulator [Salinisphaera sp.]
MQLDVIQLFCDVARERSITGAARLHGVTQSAASQRVMALERELGVQLIDRGTRPLRLTVAGEVYRRGSEDILDRYEQLKHEIIRCAGAAHTVIRVAAIYSAGIDLLNRAEERFEAEHPEIRVRVDYLQPAVVYERVREAQVDFGILSYPQQWRDLASQLLREETMVVVCAAGHPLENRTTLTPAALVGQPLVSFDASLPIANQIGAYLRRNGGDPELSHSFDNIDTIKTFVAHSDELAILPYRAVHREVEDGELVAIRLAPALSRPVAIVTSPHRPQSQAAKALIETLIAVGASGNARPEPAALA